MLRRSLAGNHDQKLTGPFKSVVSSYFLDFTEDYFAVTATAAAYGLLTYGHWLLRQICSWQGQKSILSCAPSSLQSHSLLHRLTVLRHKYSLKHKIYHASSTLLFSSWPAADWKMTAVYQSWRQHLIMPRCVGLNILHSSGQTFTSHCCRSILMANFARRIFYERVLMYFVLQVYCRCRYLYGQSLC